MTRTRALILMVACLLVAGLLRLPGLTEIPPGLHYDEAANGILAADIGLRGELPLFIASYTGKEVFFFYAAGLLTWLVGSSVFTLRLTAAFMGILTVAATYWLGRMLLADRRVAVLAAALVAVSFWHLLFSRLGFRAISQPLLQALAVAALFRGVQQNRWPWFAAGGVFLGLTGYTYLAARVFPLPLALALLALVLTGRRHRWGQLGLYLGVAVLVLAPLLVYFYQHPEAFWVRIGQVAPEAVSVDLWESYLQSLGIFFLVGDPYWRFNLPGQPLFNWLWGGLLVAGWFLVLWRWRRWWYDWQKAGVVLLVTVPFLMLLPTALAVGEIVPSNLRSIGLIPFIFYLPAFGLVVLLEQLAGLLRGPQKEGPGAVFRQWRVLEGYEVNYAFVVLLVLLWGSASTGRAYFYEWAGRADLFYDSDADLVAVAEFLDRQQLAGNVYVAALHYRHPTVAFLSDQYDRVKWLPQSEALVLPPEGEALYVYPANSPAPAWALDYLEQGTPITGPAGPDGSPLYTAYHLDNVPALTVPHTLEANLGNTLRLSGYDVAPGAGTSLNLTLYWQVTERPQEEVLPFVHLLDAWGSRWSQVESFAYPASQWQVGETVIQTIAVPLRPGTPPGYYQLRIGFFDPSTGKRLPRLDEDGRYAGDSLVIDRVAVTGVEVPGDLPEVPQGVPQEVRAGLTLLGFSRGRDPVPTGERLPLALWWVASEPQPALAVRLELMREDNTGVILLNTEPVHGTYPFERWRASEFVIDEINPEIPADLEEGAYRLHLRVREQSSGETVLTTSLGVVEVEATERSFTRPAVSYPLDVTLGNEIKLLGYDLEETGEKVYELRLVWQALAVMESDYQVFVHLLNPDGTCCLWQQDIMPQQGAYPTSRWLGDEVIVDEYQLTLPAEVAPGRYPLEVGLYLPESGLRLAVGRDGSPAGDAIFLRPLEVE